MALGACGGLRARIATLATLAATACGDSPAVHEAPSDGPAWGRGLPAHSAQLHIHGSFSEGIASFESHGYEARDVGADVIWWSDHDFRIASHRHLTRYGFEAAEEPISRGEPWPERRLERGRRTKGIREGGVRSDAEGRHRFDKERFNEGKASLRVELTSGSAEFAPHALAIAAERTTQRRSLAAGVVLELAVWPDAIGPDARGIVAVELSEHPGPDGRMQRHELRYLLVPSGDAPRDPWRHGPVWSVPVVLEPGVWNEISLPVSRDAVRGFPESDGEDNALHTLWVGVESRRGARAAVSFDDLRVEQRLRGGAAFAEYTRRIRALDAADPSLTQLVGQEHSLGFGHMNEFSADPALRDLNAAEAGRGLPRSPVLDQRRDELRREAVAEIHARGGLVSANHAFGAAMAGQQPRRTQTRESILAGLWESRVQGADLLEVGYRHRGGHPLADHLWVWDELAARELFPVGVGVSDSHGGPRQRWREGPNNFVTWIYAPSTRAQDLIDGLRVGAAFFGDLTRFDGKVDLISGRGARMGQVAVSDRGKARIRAVVEGLEAGDTVAVVESGEVAALHVAKGSQLELEFGVSLAPDRPTSVRLEVRGSDAGEKVFSNPISFVRRVPAGGIAAGRAHVDLGGVVATGFEGFHLESASMSRADDGATLLLLAGSASAGRVELRLPGDRQLEDVVFEGDMRGRRSRLAERVLLDGIGGRGALRLRFAAE